MRAGIILSDLSFIYTVEKMASDSEEDAGAGFVANQNCDFIECRKLFLHFFCVQARIRKFAAKAVCGQRGG